MALVDVAALVAVLTGGLVLPVPSWFEAMFVGHVGGILGIWVAREGNGWMYFARASHVFYGVLKTERMESYLILAPVDEVHPAEKLRDLSTGVA